MSSDDITHTMSSNIAHTMPSDKANSRPPEAPTPGTNTKTTKSKKEKLPAELQLDILDHLIEITRPTSVNHGVPHGKPLQRKPVALLHAAATCSRWRQYLMPHIYRNLFLTQRSLEVLRTITPEQRNHIQYIWLTIELPKDDAFPGRHPAAEKLRTTEVALAQLFGHLSHRPPRRADGTLKSLTLELSLSCSEAADNDGVVNETHFDSSPFLRPAEPLETNRPRRRRNCRPWVPPNVAHLESMSRATGRSPWRMFWFRPAPVVKRLIIRRQSRHQIAASTMEGIFFALPFLDSMIYEPWKFNSAHTLLDRDQDTGVMLRSLRRKVKHLVLFEDFNRHHVPEEERARSQPHLTYRFPWITTAVSRMLQLETLSASYLIDAHMFFIAIALWPPWQELRSLHLTSALLLPCRRRDRDRRVNELLRTAATGVGRSMPNLETLVLWYGAAGTACAFRFHIGNEGSATIGWRGTWLLALDEDTIAAWDEMARARTGGRPLVVETPELLQADKKALASHGQAIRMLGLEKQVIHPVSLMQIVGEDSDDGLDSDGSDCLDGLDVLYGSNDSNQSDVCEYDDWYWRVVPSVLLGGVVLAGVASLVLFKYYDD